ncbi:hypothetical protein [Andreprevotia chitinilytica]|uniref:hypothetical protein n=1 Tax=Andreprevotia chitinilytica TaxID=396808 RepID=UPI000553EF9C|nr:hypothetical protein [Andreprevotia chitinilytica]
MPNTYYIQRCFALAAALSLFAGCATQTGPGPKPSTTTPSTTAPGTTPTPTPAPSRPSPELQPPSVLIQNRTPQAILEDIVKYRTGRGMTVTTKTANRVEFSMTVQKVKVPTEARIRYLLTASGGGQLLSARVFQVANPGTTKEQITEITNDVAQQLDRELAGYAKGDWR